MITIGYALVSACIYGQCGHISAHMAFVAEEESAVADVPTVDLSENGHDVSAPAEKQATTDGEQQQFFDSWGFRCDGDIDGFKLVKRFVTELRLVRLMGLEYVGMVTLMRFSR